MKIEIINDKGEKLFEGQEEREIDLVVEREYEKGDYIRITDIEAPCYLVVQVDDVLGEALIYATSKEINYRIPFEQMKGAHSPKTFAGPTHLLHVRYAREQEWSSYRNLALNVMAQHEFEGYYPYARANVETRGEAVFAARNVIDGIKCNTSHGEWPYGSWGINQRKDATIKIDLGREVEMEELILYTRADFPHDSWWTQVTVTFSDGTSRICSLEKTEKAQLLKLPPIKASWIMLSELIKAEDESPFPALTQVEIWGRTSK